MVDFYEKANATNSLNNKETIEAMIKAIKKTSGDIRFLGAGYDNLSNFGLKSIVVTFVMWYVEKEGCVISKYNIARLLMASLLKKAEGEIQKDVKTDLCKELGVERDFFDEMIPYTQFVKEVGIPAANEMFFGDSVKEIEQKIVNFASVLTTLAELINISYKLEDSFYQETRIAMELRCQQYADMPGFDDLKSKLNDFAEIGRSLSEQIRWKLQIGGNRASVLKHIAITGILAFFNALQLREGTEEAGKCFFMGIYHDLPEVWTGDIPSSSKDRKLEDILKSYFYRYGVKKSYVAAHFDEASKIENVEERISYLYSVFFSIVGTVPEDVRKVLNLIKENRTIRGAVEVVEETFIKQNFYSKLFKDEKFDMEMKAHELMFEDEDNREKYFKLIKGVDYVGAVIEIYLIYMHGSCDKYYLGADDRTLAGIEAGKYELSSDIVDIFNEYKTRTEELVESSYNNEKVHELEARIKTLENYVSVLKSDIR